MPIRLPHYLKSATRGNLPRWWVFFAPAGAGVQAEAWDALHDTSRRYGFINTDSFWTWLAGMNIRHSRIVVSGFDLPVLLRRLGAFRTLWKLGLKVRFPIVAGRRLIWRVKKKDTTLLFVSVENFASMPVPDVAASLGEDTEDPLLVTAAFWKALCRLWGEAGIKVWCPTAPATAYRLFRQQFMDDLLLSHCHTQALLLERAAYSGGLCTGEPFKGVGDFACVDVNSEYPYIMREGTFPVRFVKLISSASIGKRLGYLLRRFYVIAETERTARDSRTPAVNTLHDGELRQALASGNIGTVKRLAIYERGQPFKRFVDFCWGLRERFADNPAFNGIAKLLAVSLYGKFGQKGYRYYHVKGAAAPEAVEIREVVKVETGERMLHVVWFGDVWLVRPCGEPRESIPSLAGAIASGGRRFLRRHMSRVGRVYYCDTDGFICDGKDIEALRGFIGGAPGQLRIDARAPTLRVWGPKRYELGERRRLAGIKAGAVRVGDTYYQTVVPGFHQSPESARPRIRRTAV